MPYYSPPGRPAIDTHNDSDYLARGSHDGAGGTLTLRNMKAHFKSCGVTAGVAIYNDTDGSNGLTVTVTETTILTTLSGGTNNTWSKDDQYSIYKTSEKDTYISHTYNDRRFGRKIVKNTPLTEDGIFPEDVDIDEHQDNVFGPGQPSKSH